VTLAPLLHKARASSRTMLWVYLLVIGAAEYITAAVNPFAGLTLHALVLAALVLHATFAPDGATRTLMGALTLAPLIRLLSLSLPLPSFRQLYWYPVVSVPLLLATALLIWQSRMPRAALGLRPGSLPLQLMIMGGGVGLGALEYLILQPGPLVRPFSWNELVIAGLILMIFTGFTEELIFRGLLQSLAIPVLGRSALVFISLLFAVLHIGYLSLVDVVFVFVVGLLFAYVVLWSGSILGVTLAHGFTNIFLFLVMPYAAESASPQLAQALPWLVVISSALALVAFALLARRAHSTGMLQLPEIGRVLAPALSRPAQATTVEASSSPAGLAGAFSLNGITAAGALDLYRRLSGDSAAPLTQVRIEDDGLGFRALLFVPARRLPPATRIKLFAQGSEFVSPERLLPPQYDFVAGAIEFDRPFAANEPHSQSVQLYRTSRMLARELRRELDVLADANPEMFQAFWAEHGGFFGIGPWLPQLRTPAATPALEVS
jgi:uncharacterized protein